MKNKSTFLLNKIIFVFVLLVILAPSTLFSQTISNVKNGSTTIAPFLGNVPFRCYNPSFDPQPPQPPNPFKFYCDFSVSSSFAPGTTFTLQFSDEFGNFPATPIVLNTAQPVFTGTTGSFTFLLPLGTSGTGYRLRVINSANASSAISAAIPCYYIPFTGTFYLLNNRVQNVSICGGGSFNLFVDTNNVSLPSAPTVIPSPTTYPGLKYKWVKDGAPFPGTGPSINITQSGVYYAYIDYGICSSVTPGLKPTTSSLDVTVNIVPGGSSFNITGNPIICPPTTNALSVTAGYSYQWFKDGVALPGETAFTYNASQPGDYSVLVNQGTCSSTSNTFNVYAVGFSASIDVSLLPNVNIIGTGETKSITITSSAASPTYEWYLNNVLIPSATSATYNATQPGKYKAVVNQTVGCLIKKEFLFELKEGVNPKEIPNLISPNDDSKNDTWILPSEYANSNTEVQIINNTGQIVLQTTNYQNNWPLTPIDFKTVNPVYYYIITKDGSQVKKGSITIIK
jgi:gliding motility-associated-like protein